MADETLPPHTWADPERSLAEAADIAAREIRNPAAEWAESRSAQLTTAFEGAARLLAEAAGDDFWLLDYPPEDEQAIAKNLGLLLRKAARNECARIRRDLLQLFAPYSLRSDQSIASAEVFVDALDRICPAGPEEPAASLEPASIDPLDVGPGTCAVCDHWHYSQGTCSFRGCLCDGIDLKPHGARG